jgi:two-component system sensor histidine kinase PhcS
MKWDVQHDNAAPLEKAYREFERNLRVRQAKAAGVLAMVLMPAGVTLDYFVYPKLITWLFAIRIACDVALFLPVAALFTPWAKKYIHVLDKAAVVLPTICMCSMIFASEGTVSPYYAGLNLVLTGVCLLFPYSLAEGAVVCSFILVSYTVACLVHGSSKLITGSHASLVGDASTLYNNLYFLALNGVIAVTACRFSSRRRFEDFKLRHDLAVNNDELATTLKKLKDTEVQLVQSEKMNALGKLSAGLLHEVNNPLNFTFMALQIAEQEAEGNESLTDTLKDIGQGMTRIRGVISDLRAFAYPSKVTDREEFKIDDALTTAVRLTAHELGDIVVERKDLDVCKAVGSKTQLVHVFMNMLVNAAQAMRKTKEQRKPVLEVSCTCKDDRLEITVRDNGSGVKAADLPRLLDPFFTTKDVGEGMGLGLSICHTIVKNHGGGIQITSQEGQWTKVAFDLPAASAQTVASTPSVESGAAFAAESMTFAGSNA